jgi:hypothetical protein
MEIGYRQVYDDGKWNKAHDEDFTTDKIPKICALYSNETVFCDVTKQTIIQ